MATDTSPISKTRAIALLVVLVSWFLFTAVNIWILWNLLFPELLGLPRIGLGQALLLSLLHFTLKLSFFKD